MGCDIHVFTEVRSTVNEETKWRNADHWMLDHYHPGKYEVVHVYRHRNYWLFTALAGVRDYAKGSPKLSEPRGMPEDASPQTLEACAEYGVDGHSHSYATLFELIQWQAKHKTLPVRGLVSPEAARLLDEQGIQPSDWCQGTSDRTWVWRDWTIEHDALGPIIKACEARAREHFWVFGDGTPIPEQHQHNYRIVFWFDN